MAQLHQLAEFAARARFEDLSPDAVTALELRIIDSLACALGALGAPPTRAVRSVVEELGGRATCTLVGGGRSAPDRAALYNGALVRYLDFNDSFLAPGETCHPSDNLAAVLAAAEAADRTGRDLLVALAVAYQVQCRLSEVAPVRDRGFDHTVQLAYGAAAGVSRALGLPAAQTASAIAIAGTAFNALRVTRTGALSQWKGLAAPHAAAGALGAAWLARAGITGPAEVFEGNKGFEQSLAGAFEIDWSKERLDAVPRTLVKRHDAEIHGQSTISALLALRAEESFAPEQIEGVSIEIFDVAHRIIGGGEEGDKRRVTTKEEADHSLPYLAAVALLDGEVGPAQYRPERIAAPDVQALLRRVEVRPDPGLSARFPAEVPCRVRLVLRDGRVLEREQADYEGFPTRPARWPTLVEKLRRLGEKALDVPTLDALADRVERIDRLRVTNLTELLARARLP